MNKASLLATLFLLCSILFFACGPHARPEIRLLVFSKTEGYRHASIPAGVETLERLAQGKGWKIDHTEDAASFNEENLARYSAVIFLSTTANVLDRFQQSDFERYIQGGGGFVGIHAAADTEYGWPWYGRLVGAYFEGHPNNPNVRTATMRILDTQHSSTAFLAGRSTWEWTDEFYNFKDIYHGPDDGIIPLIEVNESTYEGGTNGDFHPMTWYHAYDGGRAWYTNFGHTSEAFQDEDFQELLVGGINYAVGENLELDPAKMKTQRVPDPRRFQVEVLDSYLNEPTELEILPDHGVLFAQRRGELMLYDPEQKSSKQVGFVPVWTKFEDGLAGLALDPNFENNHYLYLYYAPDDSTPRFVLSRFEFRDDTLINESEKRILEVPVQRDTCCHTGGSIEWGPDGLLYLSTGDDTNPFETAYAPIDERPGKEPWDAQRSSANPSDLRGKILRLKIHPDASYSIPEGNLFAKDGSEGRPEIYVMGCRNPYRISIDSETGYLYWGDVGPDGRKDGPRGPRGYDEINQARKPGFFGWPYFIGNNYPYHDVDFETKAIKASFNPLQPLNDTRYNTGTQKLPAAQPAFIWYPYAQSPDFEELASGGRNAMAGPVYHHEDFEGKASQFPAYFDDKLFIYDFMRDWVLVVNMNAEGDLETLEPFLDTEYLKLSSPMDMAFGPDGALYIIEYGTKWFHQNEDARLIKIAYSDDNLAPRAIARADVQVGAAPLKVNFSGEESFDIDAGEELSYEWRFPHESRGTGVNTSFTFQEPGIYPVALTVTDEAGHEAEANLEIRVGNAPPELSIDVAGNQDFFWAERAISYQIQVQDTEDGSLKDGDIDPKAVSVSWDFGVSEYDPVEGAIGHAAQLAASTTLGGEALIKTNGCIACHGMEKKIIGPGYLEVAEKYHGQRNAQEYLTNKILNGGSGVWGAQAMPAMPQLKRSQAAKIADFILSMGEQGSTPRLSTNGTLRADQHEGLGEGSAYTLRASYLDQGGPVVGPLSNYGSLVLRSPKLELEQYTDETASHRVRMVDNSQLGFLELPPAGYAGLVPVDLTEVAGIELRYQSVQGGQLQLRLDRPDGPVLANLDLDDTQAKYGLVRANISSQSGRHRIFISYLPDEASGSVPLKLDWLYLEPSL